MLAGPALQSRLSKLREVWSQYMESKRQLLLVAERCCLRGWPDKRQALRSAFRLQELYCERAKLRFEYLLDAHALDASMKWHSLDSLSAISKAIETEWSSGQEVALSKASPYYAKLCEEIHECQATVRASDNAGPYRDAQRDPEYVRARQAAAEASAAYDEQLTL